jgi:hypothetical protein
MEGEMARKTIGFTCNDAFLSDLDKAVVQYRRENPTINGSRSGFIKAATEAAMRAAALGKPVRQQVRSQQSA